MVTAWSGNTFLSPYSHLLYISPFSIVQSPHSYIPIHGWSLLVSCGAAEGELRDAYTICYSLQLGIYRCVCGSGSVKIRMGSVPILSCFYWVFMGARALVLNIWSLLTSVMMLPLPQTWAQNTFLFLLPQTLNGNGPAAGPGASPLKSMETKFSVNTPANAPAHAQW